MQNGNPSSLRRWVIWSIPALIAVMLLLGVFDAIALPGCESCHDDNGFRAATTTSAHVTVDCRACHVPVGVVDRFAFAMRQPLHMFVPLTGGARRDAAAVPDARCLVCHPDVSKAVLTSGGLRIAHKTCTVGSSCTDCHSATAHGAATSWVRALDMDACLACHINEGKTACDLCHEGRRPASRIESGAFAVTHGANWSATHGMGNAATCTVCHQPADCEGCHGPGLPHDADIVRVHPRYAAADGAKCSGCHEQSFCDACHVIEMPHTREFTAGHADAARAQEALCQRCHAESDCTDCHVKHVHPGGAVGGLPPAPGGGS